MTDVRISRAARVPDELRLERYRRAPEVGPRVTFFSGGTAMKETSSALVGYTHNSVHLITPFDSGGSSAKLRQTYGMPAVGDLRNRIMALADRGVQGHPAIVRLFAHRLPKDLDQAALRESLHAMVAGDDPMIAAIPDPMRKIVRLHLGFFRERLTHEFDLRGASIGNLILAGGYFNYGRKLDPVLYLFSKLVEARGTVRPIINRDLHLAAELADGRILVGQHLLTGKEGPAIDSRIERLFMTESLDSTTPVRAEIREKTRELIQSSELICYPIGSFHSSLLANLLPTGVGSAVAGTDCPKLYVPNPSPDPEEFGLSLPQRVRRLVAALRADAGEAAPMDRLLDFVLVDSSRGQYGPGWSRAEIEDMGVRVVDLELILNSERPLFDPRRLASAIMSFA